MGSTTKPTDRLSDRLDDRPRRSDRLDDHSHRVPIFHDDLNFQDRHRSLFSDLQSKMDADFDHMGLGSGLSSRTPLGRRWGAWDDIDSLCKDFFELRPRNPTLGKLSKSSRDDFGSRESLDDEKVKGLFVEDPETKTRMFQMSFNVQDYNPEDITVRVLGDTIAVEAKHIDEKGGNKSVREFNRKIGIPKEVDPDKLSSTMSSDGILTLKAPVPPNYKSIAAATDSPRSSTPSSISSPSISHPSNSAFLPSSMPPYISTSQTYPQSSTPMYSPPPTNYQSPAAATSYPYQPPPQPGTSYPSYPYQPPMSPPRMAAPVPQMAGQQPPPMMSPPPGYYPMPQDQSFPPPPPPITQDYQQVPPEYMYQQMPATGRSSPPLDTPIYTDTPTGRRMDLVLYLGPPYTPEDILVKVDGKTLVIEALHEEKVDKKASKSSMSREFELTEDINPQTVQANLTNDGKLKLAAMAPLPGNTDESSVSEPQSPSPTESK